MGNFDFKLSTHLSIAWGITLAILTVIEWNSLGREPMRAEILSPFIQRVITVTMDNGSTPQVVNFSDAAQKQATQGDGTRLEVEFLFNGPLFLAFFFIPVLAFNGLEWLLGKLNRKPGNGSPP